MNQPTPPFIWQHAQWPRLRWREEELQEPLREARLAQARLRGMVEAIGLPAATEAAVASMAREVASNSRIEGVDLGLESVRASMMMRLGAWQGGTPPAGVRRADPVVAILT